MTCTSNVNLLQLNWHTEATAMPMAFHLLPVAAYTGAATITPCKNDQLGWALREMLQEQKSEGRLPVRRRDCKQSPSIRRWCCHHIRLTRAAKASRCCYTSRDTQYALVWPSVKNLGNGLYAVSCCQKSMPATCPHAMCNCPCVARTVGFLGCYTPV